VTFKLAFPLAVAMMLAGKSARAADWFVDVGGAQLAFSPMVTKIRPGDSVTFVNRGGVHNVVADDGSFRCAHGCDGDGQGGNGAASSQLWHSKVVFPRAGTFGYFCETHGAPGIGMYGAIRVIAPGPPPGNPSGIPLGGLLPGLLLIGAIVAVASRRFLPLAAQPRKPR